MHFEPNKLYHVYNQGNNRQTLFFSEENYRYFLRRYKQLVSPFVDTIAYCLMPNHFHFLVYTNYRSTETTRVGSLMLTQLSNGLRQLLSSYASAVNNAQHRSGSLFRQKTKSKLLENSSENYPLIAFHYTHQNPLVSGLVKRLEDWEFSSYQDYLGLRDDNLCNIALAKKLIDANWGNLERESLEMCEKKTLIGIF